MGFLMKKCYTTLGLAGGRLCDGLRADFQRRDGRAERER